MCILWGLCTIYNSILCIINMHMCKNMVLFIKMWHGSQNLEMQNMYNFFFKQALIYLTSFLCRLKIIGWFKKFLETIMFHFVKNLILVSGETNRTVSGETNRIILSKRWFAQWVKLSKVGKDYYIYTYYKIWNI